MYYLITVFNAIFVRITRIGNNIANMMLPNVPPNSTRGVLIREILNFDSSSSTSDPSS